MNKVVWVGIATAFALAVAVGSYSLYSRGYDATVWAAWVQAVGSVLAIFVAIGVAAYQSGLDQKHKIEQQNVFNQLATQTIRSLGFSARNLLEEVEKKDELDPDFVAHFSAFVEERVGPVLSIPLWSITDPTLAAHVLGIQSGLRDVKRFLQKNPESFRRCLTRTDQLCGDYLKKFGVPFDKEKLAL